MEKNEIEQGRNNAAKELMIIGEFLNQIFRNKYSKYYRLYFDDGAQMIVEYVGCAESDNDLELNDPYYEEFYEFDFRVKKMEKKSQSHSYEKEQYISLNHHDFFKNFEPYNGEFDDAIQED